MNRAAQFGLKLVDFCFGAGIYSIMIGAAVIALGHISFRRSIIAVFEFTILIFGYRAVHKLLTQSR